VGSLRLNWSCAISHLLGWKVWQVQDERGKSERKRRWRGGEIPTTQPNQRPLQVRCNGKDANDAGKYNLGRGEKSNEIVPGVEVISQGFPAL